MKLIDLAAQQRRIRNEIDRRIKTVLDHGNYILGPEVGEIESALAHFVKTKHAVSCSSGTDALLLSLMAKGVGPGDAIFTTPYTFIATAEVICLLGATPVFIDIDPETFNIHPKLLESAIKTVKGESTIPCPLPQHDPSSPLRPKGVIAVDMFGLPADYDELMPIAQQNDLFVIEDAAQSMGAQYRGRKAGNLAHVGCTSFFPAKPLGCYGDGGMCFTNDDNLASMLASLRLHGKGEHRYDNARIGINGRLDSLQAAVLLAKMEIFEDEVERRNRVADRYGEALKGYRDVLKVPGAPEGTISVWAQYTITLRSTDLREKIAQSLGDSGIASAIYYPKPLHLQTAFQHFQYQTGDFPVSEEMAQRVISLPMHPYLKKDEQGQVVEVIQKVLN